MKKIVHFFETKKGKRVKNGIIGIGASIVLVGALFKIQHWPGGGAMLVLGMGTEAFIFMLQGILPPHSDYYWEKVYPHLDVSPDVDEEYMHEHALEEGTTPSQQLDNMLEEHNLDEELIDRMGTHFEQLSTNVEKMADISNAHIATEEYATNTRAASESLNSMKTAYDAASESVSELASSTAGAHEYHDQVQQVASNLASLNSMYELELQDTNNHMKAMNNFYATLTQAAEEMQSSVNDARLYKEEIAKLAQNLSSLNSVYGNMLSAMQVNKQEI